MGKVVVDLRIEARVSVTGTVIAMLRESASLSQSDFADRCCWSQQYQSRLEAPGIRSISEDVWQRICEATRDKGAER